jgi:hypothetical protein
MNIEMIDLVDFFDDKYRNAGSMGLAAVGIITERQMVTRYTEATENNIKGTGNHFVTEGKIFNEIFGYNPELFLGFGYHPELYKKLDKDHRKALGEMCTIKYMNNATGNYIMIYLPSEQGTITENQLEMIRYIEKNIEEAKRNITRPIQIIVTDRKKSAKEINSMTYSILPFLEERINNDYKQSIPDKNIIAVEEIKNLGHHAI